ncbi:hypothetical protein ABT282_08665 [Streptomyces sp. NPDC000927]|uniref:hypothetical protein n=1 Tax=Streptomyces sp. NPDC000927 TaxID=3154371 RepID=UPI00331AA8F9
MSPKSREWYDERDRLEAKYGTPPFTLAQSLAHTLDVYSDAPDGRMVVTATSGVFGDGVVTGLSFGDLRELARKLNIEV